MFKFHKVGGFAASLLSINELFSNELGDFAKLVLSGLITFASTVALKYVDYKITAWKQRKKSDSINSN